MKKIILALLLLIHSYSFAQEQDTAIHGELRQLLNTITTAINTEDYSAMLPVISDDASITSVSSEFLQGKEAITPYMSSLFGKGKFLRKINITFTPETLTELSPDKTWGVSHGTGLEHYTLSDGREYDIKTRWTATVALEDGKWKIKTMHISTDFLDNPILSEAKAAIHKMIIICVAGVVGALLMGLLIGFFIFRKKKI